MICSIINQELLREKQMHIEQLMIERDMDREETHNEALRYQKSINEVINQRQTSTPIDSLTETSLFYREQHPKTDQLERAPLAHLILSDQYFRPILSNNIKTSKPSSLAKHSFFNYDKESPRRTIKRVWFCD